MANAVTKYVFKSIIEVTSGGGAAVLVPAKVIKSLNDGKRPKVKATIDGQLYRTSLAPYGGKHYLGILKDIRKKINKDVGHSVQISLEQDLEVRQVDIPDDLKSELARHPNAQAFFDTLAFTPKKEIVRWIESAKKQKTRATRIQEAIAKLSRAEKL